MWYLRNRYARGRPLLRPVRQSANRRRAKPGNATRRRRAEHRSGPQTAAPAAPPGDHLGGRGHRGARGAGRHGLAGALAPPGPVRQAASRQAASSAATAHTLAWTATEAPADRRGSQCGARRGGLPADGACMAAGGYGPGSDSGAPDRDSLDWSMGARDPRCRPTRRRSRTPAAMPWRAPRPAAAPRPATISTPVPATTSAWSNILGRELDAHQPVPAVRGRPGPGNGNRRHRLPGPR